MALAVRTFALLTVLTVALASRQSPASKLDKRSLLSIPRTGGRPLSLSFAFEGESAPPANSRPFPIVYEDGTPYTCYFPEQPVDFEPPVEISDEGEQAGKKLPVWPLLEPLREVCLIMHTGGWWSYRFCYGADFTQFHELEGKNVGAKYVLGTALGGQPESSTAREGEYIEHMGGGTPCDVGGNKQRQIDVVFQCSPSSPRPGVLKSVVEVATCEYRAIVGTPLVCTHALFRKDAEPKEGLQADNVVCLTPRQKGLEDDQCALTAGEGLAHFGDRETPDSDLEATASVESLEELRLSPLHGLPAATRLFSDGAVHDEKSPSSDTDTLEQNELHLIIKKLLHELLVSRQKAEMEKEEEKKKRLE